MNFDEDVDEKSVFNSINTFFASLFEIYLSN